MNTKTIALALIGMITILAFAGLVEAKRGGHRGRTAAQVAKKGAATSNLGTVKAPRSGVAPARERSTRGLIPSTSVGKKAAARSLP